MGEINVRSMTVEDFAFAIRLSNTMNWGLREEDFALMMDLEPEGCFVAWNNEERVGIATTIEFGPIGWIGNLIVSHNHRSRGVGSQLGKHAVKYLTGRSVTTIGLFSYEELVPFYEKFGFKCDTQFVRLVGSGAAADLGTVNRMVEKDLQRVFELDESCTGMLRDKLLRRIFADWKELCYVSYKNTRLVGFIMARETEVGPLICLPDFQEESIILLQAVQNALPGQTVYLGLAKQKKKILSFLRNLNFKDDFSVVKMYRGDPPESKDCVVAMESLERG